MRTIAPAPTISAPLRIIQVVNVRWFNATAWYGLFLASLLREAGHEVRVLGLKGTESFAKAEEWGLAPETVDLNTANPFAVASVYADLRRLVRDFDPHIVNCHRGESFFLWALLKRSARFALVRTRGDQRPPKANAANTIIHAKLADAVIATSSGIAAGVRDILHVPAERVHTILGGVDTQRFFPDPEARAAMRDALGLHQEHKAIGLVGRFDTVKGQKELIAAFARARHELGTESANVRLVLAGFATSAVSEDAVRSWVEAAGVGDSVLLPGRSENVRALMNALDLGVVASLGSETIARVALEIMACGVPLVGTNVGVMPDLLDDAALVSPGDTHAMAALIRRFVTESGFGENLAVAQAERMASLGESDFYTQTMAVYRKVLQADGR
ncbi:glycosyltransferase [Desulfovibrio sp. OttesenSCG-928-O18]|nr:glycosyltransferase [Desulfovibrio sp. OttesenSCG-928-O18]